MNKIIGISGVAGCGKDTFYSLLSQSLPCSKFSLADEPKKEVQQWCRMHYGIDSVTCSREEQELISAFLVYHGTAKRRASEGRHWIDKLNDSIINDKSGNYKIITDIRYDEYENDEVSWLKNELNGILIHVSMYSESGAFTPRIGEWDTPRNFKPPANKEESRNDPKIKEKSNFLIEWKFLENGQIDELHPHVDEFVRWLSQQKNEKSLPSTTPQLGK